MKNRFKVGDIIVGNKYAKIYSITGVGSRCKVTEIIHRQTNLEDCDFENEDAPPDIMAKRIYAKGEETEYYPPYPVASCLFDLACPSINLKEDLLVKQIKNTYKK